MADPALKTVTDPALKIVTEPKQKASKKAGQKLSRGRLRLILLVVVPLIAAVAGLTVYLYGGRYISTDNAYVGAQKVLITPDISGKIAKVTVREGQRVAPGDVLFAIDPTPFQIALTQAEGKLSGIRTDFATLKTNYESLGRLIELATQTVDLKQKDVDRKTTLVGNRSGSQADVDNAMAALVTAQNQLERMKQQQAEMRNQLLGDSSLPIEKYPPFVQNRAALEQAQRDLDHTTLRAPIGGVATQVDSIQLGRYVTAGTPILSVIDDSKPWVDANPKETDVTNLRLGQKVTIDIDAFPGRAFHGTVISMSPGTGAQFVILPPQNASGNWVKVVQRVPVRIQFDDRQDLSLLRAGMSVTVEIDTQRRRTLAGLLGLSSVASESKP
jgi:membrane fusion protein (multidrug efflux system)